MNLDVYDDDGLDDSRIADVTAHAALTSHCTTSPRMTCGTFDLFQPSQDDPSPMPTLIFTTLYHSITLLICMTKFNLTAIIMSFPDKYYSVAVNCQLAAGATADQSPGNRFFIRWLVGYS